MQWKSHRLDNQPKTVKGRNTLLLHSNIEELVHLEIDHGDNNHIKYHLWVHIGLLHPIWCSPAERQVLKVRVFLHFSSVEYVNTDSGLGQKGRGIHRCRCHRRSLWM